MLHSLFAILGAKINSRRPTMRLTDLHFGFYFIGVMLRFMPDRHILNT
jgi:hypothetical protein